MRLPLTTASILGFIALVALPNAARPCSFSPIQEGHLLMDVQPPECLVFELPDAFHDTSGEIVVQYRVRNECMTNVEISLNCDGDTSAHPDCEPQWVPPSGLLEMSHAPATVRWKMEKMGGQVEVGIKNSDIGGDCGSNVLGCSAGGSGALPMLPALLVLIVLVAMNHRRRRMTDMA